MQPFSRKITHALEAIIEIAINAGGQPVNGKQLAERLALPPRYLERMLQQCVHQGILRSIRGPRGGYVLARERRKISLGELYHVLQSADEDEAVTPGSLADRLFSPINSSLQKMMREHLESITLADLCDKAYDMKFYQQMKDETKGKKPQRTDFAI